jgi:hypothetical protein
VPCPEAWHHRSEPGIIEASLAEIGALGETTMEWSENTAGKVKIGQGDGNERDGGAGIGPNISKTLATASMSWKQNAAR